MDIRAFKASIDQKVPPDCLSRPLQALWHAAKGNWDAAHCLVQKDEGDPTHDWVHACLHRIEGDIGNAGYWYRQAKKPPATGSCNAEVMMIAETLLTEDAK